jgi:hypothetical protein
MRGLADHRGARPSWTGSGLEFHRLASVTDLLGCAEIRDFPSPNSSPASSALGRVEKAARHGRSARRSPTAATPRSTAECTLSRNGPNLGMTLRWKQHPPSLMLHNGCLTAARLSCPLPGGPLAGQFTRCLALGYLVADLVGGEGSVVMG